MNIKEKLKSLWQHTSSPHQMALGFTAGLACSMVPVPFVGMLAGVGLAGLLRANMVTAYIGTAVMNPLTGPIIFFAELWLGLTVMQLPVPAWSEVRAYSAGQWFAMLRDLAGPFGIGIAVAIVASVVIGYPLAYFASKVLKERFKHLHEKHAHHAAAADATQEPPSASNETSSGS